MNEHIIIGKDTLKKYILRISQIMIELKETYQIVI